MTAPSTNSLNEYGENYSVAAYTKNDVKLWLKKMCDRYTKPKYDDVFKNYNEKININKEPIKYLKRVILDTIRLNLKPDLNVQDHLEFLKLYDFVFCVLFDEVPLHLGDCTLSKLDFVKWRLEVGK